MSVTSEIISTMMTSTQQENLTSAVVSSYVLPFTEAWVIASTTILVLFLVFGVSANIITIAAIYTSPRLKNRYYTMLSSLCVSDIISALISILFLYRRIWGFLYFAWPDFFCRLYWGVDLWTSFSTAMHILSFAILRLIGVRWPTRFRQITENYMRLWIASIWLLTFLCGFIPHFLFNTARVIDREDPTQSRWASCSLDPKWIPTWQIYVQIVYGFFLLIPALAIIGISIAISVLLRRRQMPTVPSKNTPAFVSVSKVVANQLSKVQSTPTGSPKLSSGYGSGPGTPIRKTQPRNLLRSSETALQRRRKKDKQAVTQLLLIVGSFLLGYIPLTAFHFYTGITLNESSAEINAFDWKFAMVQYILLRFSECLNPVFYNLASQKMRDETKNMLKRFFKLSKFFTETQQIAQHRHHTGTSSEI